jgi:hypothetical protein
VEQISNAIANCATRVLHEVRGPNPDLDAAITTALDWRAEELIVVTSELLFSHDV